MVPDREDGLTYGEHAAGSSWTAWLILKTAVTCNDICKLNAVLGKMGGGEGVSRRIGRKQEDSDATRRKREEDTKEWGRKK